MTPTETYTPATPYTDLRSWTLIDPQWPAVLWCRLMGWFYYGTILLNMGMAPVPEAPKFPPPKTWNERHSHGWDEWHAEKDEAVPVIKWGDE